MSDVKQQGWERLYEAEGEYVERMRIPGGWLYRSESWPRDDATLFDLTPGVAMVFVPASSEDEDHLYRGGLRAARWS